MEEGQNNPDKEAGLNIEKVRKTLSEATDEDLRKNWEESYGENGIWRGLSKQRSVRTAKK